ncbi:MAG: hypothetical protein KKB22_08210 [Candidatus Omnitrophica bacterium]|nr:hypothetical protein [Candidatus Omnitrophota bacterium]
MDKAKTNFMVVIAVLAVLCIIFMGYSASLNSQLGTEKTRTMQLNDQIAGLNSKVNDLKMQLNNATAQSANQGTLASNLQSSLNTAMAEIDNLKMLKAELELKLESAVSSAVSKITTNAQQAITATTPAKQ